MDIQINNKHGKTLKTKDTYVTEDINVIPVLEDVEATSNNADGITPSDGYSGIGRVIVNVPIPESEEKTVDLNMSSGNQVINPSTNKVMSKVTVNKPATLLSQNIKKDVAIGGITGTLEPKRTEQEKTVTVTENGTQTVTPDSEKTLSKVTVITNVPSDKKEEQEKTVSITANGTSTVQPDSGKVLSKVTINTNVQPNLEEKTVNVTTNGSQEITPTSGKDGISKVKLNVNVPSSGGADLNIYYGDTAPEDTSKLWIKSSEPENITFSAEPEQSIDGIQVDLVLPTGLCFSANVAVGEDIYIFGGQTSTSIGKDVLNTIYKYNTKAKTLTLLETVIPTPLTRAVGIAYGTTIYLFGGRYSSSSTSSYIYKYNTLSDTITRLTSYLPNETERTSAALVDDKIYLFGGSSSNSSISVSNTIIMFDVTTENVARLTVKLPYYAKDLCSVAVGDKVYIFYAGYAYTNASESSDRIETKQYEIFDTLTQTITTVATSDFYLSSASYSPAEGEAIGSKIYVFFWNGTIKILDTITGEITISSSTIPTSNAGGSTLIGKSVYFVGGWGELRKDLIMFTITFPLEKNDILIQEGYLKNTFVLVKAPTKVEMSAQNAYKGNAIGEAEFVDAYVFNKSYWKNINTEEKLPIYTLSVPTNLSLSASTLSWTAVSNAKTYEIFSDGASLGTATTNSIDLSTLSSWSTITVGTHSLTVKAKSDEYLDSPASSAVKLTIYSIDTSETVGATVAKSDPTTIVSGGTATLHFTATSNTLPSSVTVTGADYTWTPSDDYSTATLVLSNPTSNITVKILPALSSPTNVTVDGTTASWDKVENATSYELFVDGVSIGESAGE